MEGCKSPEAEALVAAAVRGPNQAASDATRVEAEAYAAVAAVQAGVDDNNKNQPLWDQQSSLYLGSEIIEARNQRIW